MKELGAIDNEELDYCAKALNSDHHYKHQRREVTVSKFVESKDKTKWDNTMIKVSSAHFALLLEGKV